MRIAVIGTGISGNLIARLLCTDHEVHVFEANNYVGGHTNTVEFTAFGRAFSADTGFMVFNDRTYANFCQLLDLLGIESQPSDMSFSVRCERTDFEYQGSSLNGLFAQRSNLLRPRFYRMLRDIVRFNESGTAAVARGALEDGQTLGNFLQRLRVGETFRERYLVPMAAAIWSAKPEQILDFPAKFFLGFCHNHGLMQVRNRPRWKTVKGGARSYVDALIEPFRDRIRLGCAVESVARSPDRVIVRTRRGRESFDQVVFATHADQTLRMLDDPTRVERQILSSFPYQQNEAVLHTDTSLLPRRSRAWASWNYHLSDTSAASASVTYDLSRLQNLDSPSPILLTLNQTEEIAADKTITKLQYQHPAFSLDSIAAQRRQGEINGRRRSYFCGAYWGYGFHEDGVNSALAVAKCFGKVLDDVSAPKLRMPQTSARLASLAAS